MTLRETCQTEVQQLYNPLVLLFTAGDDTFNLCHVSSSLFLLSSVAGVVIIVRGVTCVTLTQKVKAVITEQKHLLTAGKACV